MKNLKFLILITFQLNSFGQIPNTLSTEDKLYSVSKFWQEVNYNFVYLDRINRKSWDSLYKATLTAVYSTKNDYEYYRLLDKFCAYLKDGHTNILYPKNLIQNIMINDFGEYKIVLSNIDQRAIITKINVRKKDEIPIGSEVLKVNGLSTSEYIDQFVKPYISASTNHVLQNQAVSELLKGTVGQKFVIELLKPDGQKKTLKLKHQLCNDNDYFPPVMKRDLLVHKTFENDIHYLALNSFGNRKIDTLFKNILPELYNAKRLIIDLRNNGGGSTNIGVNILQYFTNDTVLFGSKSISRKHIPVYKAWGAFLTPSDTLNDRPDWDMTKEEMTMSYRMANDLEYYEFPYEPTLVNTKEKRIIIPTVVLIGNNTASAAEDFLIFADALPHFKFIGDKSYGSTGQPYLFNLAGEGRARVCTKKDIYPDGREFVGFGISPDVFVKYNLDDYIHSKDPVLQKAIDILKQ